MNKTGPKPTVFPGEKYGRLTVIEFAYIKPGNGRFYLCICECGNEKVASGYLLRDGQCKSCGCLQADHCRQMAKDRAGKPRRMKHGYAQGEKATPEYKAWCAAKNRCYNQNLREWDRYWRKGNLCL